MEADVKNGLLKIKNKAVFFETIINSVGASIHIIKIDKEGHSLPVWMNEKYPIILGYTLDERQKIGFADVTKNIYHPDDIELIKHATPKVLVERETFHIINFRGKEKHGDWQWFSISAQAITINSDPDYILIVAIPLNNMVLEYQGLLDRYYKEILQLKNEIKLNRLSKIEKEIITFLAKGLTTKQVSQQRIRSYDTINNHKRNIFKKLNLHNIAELVAFAKETGLD